MSEHTLAYVFYGVGLVALIFSLVRTYYLVWKIRKETRLSRPPRPVKPPEQPKK